MKAILIDSLNEKVSLVDVEKGLDAIYEKINCSCITAITLENNDTIFVDDEGLLKLNEASKFFFINGYPQALAGNGLILGTDKRGNSTDVKSQLADITQRVLFLNMQQILALVNNEEYKE